MTSLEQAIRNGIEVEKAAERFYRLLADSTDDKDAKAFLSRLANQEVEHAKRIMKMKEDMHADSLPELADDNVETIETLPQWAMIDNISLEQAIELAKENEEHAALYYGALADATEGQVSDFFIELEKDETAHVNALNKMLNKS